MNNQNNSAYKAHSRSSDKLLQILECLSQNRVPMRLLDIANQVGLTPTTVIRYLQALQNENYIYQDELSRYGFTWKICQIAEGIQSFSNLRTISSPFINNIATALQLSSCLVVAQNDDCIYLDCVDNRDNIVTTLVRIGKQAPMHATGSGKVLLSAYNDVQLDEYIVKKGLPRFTKKTITDREEFFAEIEKVRECGYGTDIEEWEMGLRCISLPLYDYAGRIVAAISVFGKTAAVTDDRIESEIYPMLKSASESISARLGYSKPANE